MSKIDDLLADEGTAAEVYEMPEQLPEGVIAKRQSLGRPTVVSLRLSAGEHAALQQAATEANLPLSTLVRIWALDRLRAERQGSAGTVSERLTRLENEVFRHSA